MIPLDQVGPNTEQEPAYRLAVLRQPPRAGRAVQSIPPGHGLGRAKIDRVIFKIVPDEIRIAHAAALHGPVLDTPESLPVYNIHEWEFRYTAAPSCRAGAAPGAQADKAKGSSKVSPADRVGARLGLPEIPLRRTRARTIVAGR